MDWNGVFGTVASVVNTALPLFFGLLSKEGDDDAAQIGPVVLYREGDTLRFGNFESGNPPVLFNFAAPEGTGEVNLVAQVKYGQSFDAESWIAPYTDGYVTIGMTPPAIPQEGVGAGPEGVWSFLTHAVVGVGQTITAMVNPSLSLILRLEANNQVVAITALGVVGYLGGKYLMRASNNAGQSGTRTGSIAPQGARSLPAAEGETEYTADLPSGIDYSQGIYELNLQLSVNLDSESFASDPSIVFHDVPPERIEKILAASRRRR